MNSRTRLSIYEILESAVMLEEVMANYEKIPPDDVEKKGMHKRRAISLLRSIKNKTIILEERGYV